MWENDKANWSQIRIIFRLVELIPGANYDNPLLTNEVYVFCLDALPVFIGLVLLNIVHPGRVLRGADSEFPTVSRAEKKELKRQKKDAKKVEKQAKRDAKIQRKMERKMGSDVWVEVDREEMSSLDNSRHDQSENQGLGIDASARV
ncbi:RTA1 domain-containing protein [Candidatus Bathyarchaeota archaeon]|nr:RTA1 domain-containing protein [Candidatus Bathyarchaeota archaeon]